MSLKLALLLALLAASAGIGFGYLLRLIISLGKKGSMELDIKQMEIRAREEAQKVILEAEEKAKDLLHKTQVELKERENRNKSAEDRLIKKEELLDNRQVDLDKEIEYVKGKANEARLLKEKIEELVLAKTQELSKAANLSMEGAKNELLKIIEREYEEDFMVRMQKLESQGQERLDKKARDILATAIQRLAAPISGEVMATSISLPSDEVKGKIIGKEGRNIKAFER
ncbi:MAG: Rnase Y domain-containing protein, partial [Patescibacteria group bacterium]